jgi:hypothetical protein
MQTLFRRMRVLSLSALMLAGATSAVAQTQGRQTGTITEIISLHNGVVVFTMNGSQQSRPTCATTGRWAINTATPGGQTLMAHILMAQSQGKTVSAVGNGLCQIWSDSEDVVLIQTT